jgi:hypothetical protein
MSSAIIFGRLPRTAAGNHRGRVQRRRLRFRPRLEALEGRLVPATTFTVTNVGDNGGINPAPGAGTGTLRQAIIDANATPGPDVIQFNIASSGVQTIQSLSPLPAISRDSITIDATTEGGYSGSPVVVLDGTKDSSPAPGLEINGTSCVVKGLAIIDFVVGGIAIHGAKATNDIVESDWIGTSDGVNPSPNGYGVLINNGATKNTVGGTATGAGNVISGNKGEGVFILNGGTTDNQVLANLIGTTADGSHALPNQTGVGITGGASNNTVGAVGAGNVISGNNTGVHISDSGTTGNQVLANFIGTTADGSQALGNSGDGVDIFLQASNNAIGAAGAGNVISANGAHGVAIVSANGNQVLDNLIGTTADGSHALGNGYNGVLIGLGSNNNTVGGAGVGNLIAYNGAAGVVVGAYSDFYASTGDTISQNAIFSNGKLGIDLGADGVTPNTPGGPHPGPNHLQNYPVLTPYATPGTLTGTLNSTPNTTFVLEFFANPAPDLSGHGPGQDFLGSEKLTTDAAGNAVFVFTYLPFPGEPYLSATATNASTGDTSEFSATVDAALTATGLTLAATEGAQFNGAVATFTDPDANAAPASFTASIDWGDGNATPGTVVRKVGGGFAVSGSHTYGEEGSKTITVTITDVAANAQVTTISAANVSDPAVVATGGFVVSALQGMDSGPQTVATFTDPGQPEALADYSASIDWGDGHTSPGTITQSGSVFTVQGSHTYNAEEGSKTITVTIHHDSAPDATATSTATVAAGLTPTGLTLAATEGAQFSGTVATFTDADPDATAADYTASIAWGDGVTTTGQVVNNPGGGFAVTGSHTYGEEASALPVTATITDVAANAQVTANSVINVADASLTAVSSTPVSAVEGAKFSAQLGTFFDPDPGAAAGDYTVTITWGDHTTSTGTVTALGNGLFAVNGTHTYSEEGKYTFSWLVQDAGGATATGSANAKVADAPLQGTGKTLSVKPPTFTFSGVVATFTDADPGGVLADYAATIAWGDGTSGPGTIGSSNGVFTVSGSHKYGFFTGKRKIIITITDAGGSTVTVVSTVEVKFF